MTQVVKDINGVEVTIEDGYLNAITVDPKDVEYLEEVLSEDIRGMVEFLMENGIFTKRKLKKCLENFLSSVPS
jgi:hypothetical protein